MLHKIIYRLCHFKPKLFKIICYFIIYYFKSNPTALFIIGSMVLLMSGVFLLIAEIEKASESLANWAYLLLVIGVLIELNQQINFVRGSSKLFNWVRTIPKKVSTLFGTGFSRKLRGL